MMLCLRCLDDVSGDYPACSKCAPLIHFTWRTDCRCQDVECTAKRLSAHAPTENDHNKAVIQGGVLVLKSGVQ